MLDGLCSLLLWLGLLLSARSVPQSPLGDPTAPQGKSFLGNASCLEQNKPGRQGGWGRQCGKTCWILAETPGIWERVCCEVQAHHEGDGTAPRLAVNEPKSSSASEIKLVGLKCGCGEWRRAWQAQLKARFSLIH